MATKKKIRIYSVDPNTGEALKDQILYPETSTECIIDPQTGKKLSTDLKNIDQAISKEAADRNAAIADEASARSQADSALGDRIDNETTARQNADTTLQGNINNEADIRRNADIANNTKIDNHIGDTHNPHGVSKSQVGLGNVVNTGDSATPTVGGEEKFTTGGAYTLKSELHQEVVDEATARGNADNRIEGKIDTHTADISNPHSVTKAQVGLGNVENTGDSDTPVENGTEKFTTGGAYILKTNLEQADSDLDARIDTIEEDYLVEADKTALQGNIDSLADTVSDNYTELDGRLDNFIDNTKIDLQNKQIIINSASLPYGTSGTLTLVQTNAQGKLDTAVIPDAIVGQMIYGGTVEFDKEHEEGLDDAPIATLSANAKTKLGTTLPTITLTNDDTPITGYVDNENIYYICKNDGNFASITYAIGDWILSTNEKWDKIENTDAVTSVNGQVGNVFVSFAVDNNIINRDTPANIITSQANPYNGATNPLATMLDIPVVPITGIEVNGTAVTPVSGTVSIVIPDAPIQEIQVNGTTITPTAQGVVDLPEQVNADWNATVGYAQILNKPILATVATSGDYNDLSNTPDSVEANTGSTPSGNLVDLQIGNTVYNIPQGEIYTAGSGIDITNNIISIATGIGYSVEGE